MTNITEENKKILYSYSIQQDVRKEVKVILIILLKGYA